MPKSELDKLAEEVTKECIKAGDVDLAVDLIIMQRISRENKEEGE